MNLFSQLIVSHWTEVITFLLVLARTSALVMGAPFWGGATTPRMVRIAVTVGLSVTVYPFVPVSPTAEEQAALSLMALLLLVGREVLIGLTIGWSAQLLFAGMRLAAQHIEVKMGIGLTQLFDPQEGGHSSLLPVLLDLLASLVFLAVNGHHMFIRALIASFRVFPLAPGGTATAPTANAGVAMDLLRLLIESGSGIFPLALRVSAPVVIGLLLADVVLGVISRAVPQLNLFAVILPAQFAFGLLLFFLALPLWVWFCVDQLSTISDQLTVLFSPQGRQ